jgi:hypothetical protein
MIQAEVVLRSPKGEGGLHTSYGWQAVNRTLTAFVATDGKPMSAPEAHWPGC